MVSISVRAKRRKSKNKKAYQKKSDALFYLVGLPRFELGMTGPESVVLPLHHSPIAKCGANLRIIRETQIKTTIFFKRFTKCRGCATGNANLYVILGVQFSQKKLIFKSFTF